MIQTMELINVKKGFRGIQALDGMSLTIQQGDIYALLGHNGAGKTTTLRFLLGLLEPEEGEVSVFGLNPIQEGDRVRGMCGVLSEETGLYLPLTVYDNLSFYAKLYGMKKQDYDRRIDSLLEQFEILEKKNLPVKGFSTGMKKKVALIRALLHRPKILLLDEPTNGLDPVSIEKLRMMLHDLVENHGTTVILTTHNLDEVQKICNRISILRHGRNVYTNTMEALGRQAGKQVSITCGNGFGGRQDQLRLALESHGITGGITFQGNSLTVKMNEQREAGLIVQELARLGIDVENVTTGEFDLEKLYMEIEAGGQG